MHGGLRLTQTVVHALVLVLEVVLFEVLFHPHAPVLGLQFVEGSLCHDVFQLQVQPPVFLGYREIFECVVRPQHELSIRAHLDFLRLDLAQFLAVLFVLSC